MRMKAKLTVCITLFASPVLWSCNEENRETPRATTPPTSPSGQKDIVVDSTVYP